MVSKYYNEEGTCSKCGASTTHSYMVGVSQPLNTLCTNCKSEEREERINRVLGATDVWYRPDSDEYVIAVRKPDGGRWYYRHDIHAVQTIERVYGGDDE